MAAAAPAAADGKKMLTLQASDGHTVQIEKEIMNGQYGSMTIKNMVEDIGEGADDAPIPIPNVSGVILQKVVEYQRYRHAHPLAIPEDEKEQKRTDNIDEWDQEFCKVDQGTLFELILAANFLDLKPLLDLCCKTVANMIKGKTPEEIRRTFNIKNDFTPEEEAAVQKENEWCEEK